MTQMRSPWFSPINSDFEYVTGILFLGKFDKSSYCCHFQTRPMGWVAYPWAKHFPPRSGVGVQTPDCPQSAVVSHLGINGRHGSPPERPQMKVSWCDYTDDGHRRVRRRRVIVHHTPQSSSCDKRARFIGQGQVRSGGTRSRNETKATRWGYLRKLYEVVVCYLLTYYYWLLNQSSVQLKYTAFRLYVWGHT